MTSTIYMPPETGKRVLNAEGISGPLYQFTAKVLDESLDKAVPRHQLEPNKAQLIEEIKEGGHASSSLADSSYTDGVTEEDLDYHYYFNGALPNKNPRHIRKVINSIKHKVEARISTLNKYLRKISSRLAIINVTDIRHVDLYKDVDPYGISNYALTTKPNPGETLWINPWTEYYPPDHNPEESHTGKFFYPDSVINDPSLALLAVFANEVCVTNKNGRIKAEKRISIAKAQLILKHMIMNPGVEIDDAKIQETIGGSDTRRYPNKSDTKSALESLVEEFNSNNPGYEVVFESKRGKKHILRTGLAPFVFKLESRRAINQRAQTPNS